jgi:HEAT repeat protein
MTDVSPPVLAAIIDGLTQLGSPRVVDLARLSMASDSAQVRLAAIRCLGALGDTAAIPLLEKPAAYASGPEKEAARAALVRLHYSKVSDGLVAQLRTADAPIKAEAARALGLRGDTSAVPALLESAAGDADVVRLAGLKAIGLLGRPKDIDAVVALVVKAKTDDVRAAAAEALNAIVQRSNSAKTPVDLRAITNAIVSASPEARIELADMCSRLATPQARDALRAAARDQDAKVRESAIRATC